MVVVARLLKQNKKIKKYSGDLPTCTLKNTYQPAGATPKQLTRSKHTILYYTILYQTLP